MVARVDVAGKGAILSLFGHPEINAKGKGILLPALCHSHIHIDKCFLLDQCLPLQSGTFGEALKVTTTAKSRFPHMLDDVYARGKRLVVESVQCGVTSMRAHVEVDKIVHTGCLDVALRLKEEFRDMCEIQISGTFLLSCCQVILFTCIELLGKPTTVFAQDPLFDSKDAAVPGVNYDVLLEAARTSGVSSIGSAPYVEPSTAQALQNISLLLALALNHDLLVDFHLDYNINPTSEPLIYALLDSMKAHKWTSRSRKVTIGHGTRYSLFTSDDWTRLKAAIGDLPVAFVGLPQSDTYMMGKGGEDPALLPPRGTIPVPFVASHGLEVSLSINNIDNAFTPQGTVDPLGLCTLGVALYQDATPAACRTLLKCVSTSSKSAIGLDPNPADLLIKPGDAADFVLLHDNHSIQSAVLNPSYARTTIRGGLIVATRRVERWSASSSRSRHSLLRGTNWGVWVAACLTLSVWGCWRMKGALGR
ncbi:hypothetical protein OF83DRAFT_590059 [Amylostereum chailletii]|nr:hypothetical protein OF83DRAFT_590059 [Amylostereum chailletii]